MLRLPGLIDPHVHLREPGATHKEDFDTGTAAALAGGFTAVLAMPNTEPPITDRAALLLARRAARSKARCDYGLFLGGGAALQGYPPDLTELACGLKLYLDQTFGPLRIAGLGGLLAHISAWSGGGPIACHAEGRSLAAALMVAHLHGKPLHICHVSRAEEIALIRLAKERGIRVTCEVTPHHLFLTEDDLSALPAGRGEVRPPLASRSDQTALWDNLEVIDCFATDHAPHTLAEKLSERPPPGFPGLETALALLLGAVAGGRLTLEGLIRRCHTNPRRIFSLAEQHDTWIEVDLQEHWEVQAADLHSRCGWTPFEGWKLTGKVHSVTLRGQLAYRRGELLAAAGYGLDAVAMHTKVST